MAQITHVDIGDLMTPQATFTVSGTPTDPTNLTVRQQDSAGTETILLNNVLTSTLNAGTSPVAKTGTGVYKLNPGVSATSSGYWFFRFEGTGAATAAEEFEYVADPSEFTSNGGLSTRALVTLAETKAWLKQLSIDTSDDMDLVRTINAVSERLHQEAEREFKVVGSNPQTRLFDIDATPSSTASYIDGDFRGFIGPLSRSLPIGDLASATTVTIVDRDWSTVLSTPAASLYALKPLVRQAWEPATEIEFNQSAYPLSTGMRVSILGSWGFPSVPEDIRQACLDSVAWIHDRDVTHWRQDLAPVPSAPEAGTTLMMFGGSQRILSLPPSALATAWSYRFPTVS